MNKIAAAQRREVQELGRAHTPEELAARLDLTAEKVVEIQKYGREPVSLHTPPRDDGSNELGDLIEDAETVSLADAVAFTLLREELHPRT